MNRENIIKRTSLFFLAAALLCTCIPVLTSAVRVSAAEPGQEEAAPAASEPWDGSTAESYAGGSGTKGDPYLIATAEQLALLAEDIREDRNAECSFRLISDIVLNENFDYEKFSADGQSYSGEAVPVSFLEWTPEGIFRGSFDGDGHTVSGLYINGGNSIGLFSAVSEEGVIQNLHVVNSYIYSGKGWYVGGIAGTVSGIIRDCSFSGAVTGHSNVGGIAGLGPGRERIIGCLNLGNISGRSNMTAGIGGYMQGEIISCLSIGTVNRGGAIAGSSSTTVDGCCYLEGSAGYGAPDSRQGACAVTEEQLASGEAAYLLNHVDAENPEWGQALGKDPMPVPYTENPDNCVYKIQDGSAGNYVNADGLRAVCEARIGYDGYPSIYAAWDAAAAMDSYNGVNTFWREQVPVRILKDIRLEKVLTAPEDPEAGWEIRLTSEEGERYTITRDPEKVPGYMIDMGEGLDGSVAIDNLILDSGASADPVFAASGNAFLGSGAALSGVDVGPLTVLFMSGEIQIGKVVFADKTSYIDLQGPVTGKVTLDYGYEPGKNTLTVFKSSSWTGENQDTSQFVLDEKWNEGLCLYVSDLDPDEIGTLIEVGEHSGGIATCTGQAVCANCGRSYGEPAGHHYVDGRCTVCGMSEFGEGTARDETGGGEDPADADGSTAAAALTGDGSDPEVWAAVVLLLIFAGCVMLARVIVSGRDN